MESDWRWNVWLYGFWGTPMELYARTVSGPFHGICEYPPAGPSNYVATQLNPFTGTYEIVATFPKVGSFPYGWEVEPD